MRVPIAISLGVHVALVVTMILVELHGAPDTRSAATIAHLRIVDGIRAREDADVDAPYPLLVAEPVEEPSALPLREVIWDSTAEEEVGGELVLPPEVEEPSQGAPLQPPDIPLEAATRRKPTPVPPPSPSPHDVSHPVPRPTRAVASPPRRPLRAVFRPSVAQYYPRRAREQGIEGRVVVDFAVDARGVVRSARVVSSSGHRILDEAAIRLVRAFRFALGGGGRARQAVEFVLAEGRLGS